LTTDNHDVGRDEILDLEEVHLSRRDVEEACDVRLEPQVSVRDALRTMNEEGVHTLHRLVAEGVKLLVAEEGDWVAQAPIAVLLVEARDHVDELPLEAAIVRDEVGGLGPVLMEELVDHLGREAVGAAALLFDGDGDVERVIWLIPGVGWAEVVSEVTTAEGGRQLIDELGEDSKCETARDHVVIDE